MEMNFTTVKNIEADTVLDELLIVQYIIIFLDSGLSGIYKF